MRVFPCREHGAQTHNAGSRLSPERPHPSTPGFGASVSANASPNATMQATPSGLTRRTEKPPASLAVTIISAPVDVRPDTRGV